MEERQGWRETERDGERVMELFARLRRVDSRPENYGRLQPIVASSTHTHTQREREREREREKGLVLMQMGRTAEVATPRVPPEFLRGSLKTAFAAMARRRVRAAGGEVLSQTYGT
ncbi:hypothetical protein LY76DRAFT_343714 [Colletotrichum caudatum]|nr:hypothetical protein LY76DRAFT_343714 [Colletotrichum caudatum]